MMINEIEQVSMELLATPNSDSMASTIETKVVAKTNKKLQLSDKYQVGYSVHKNMKHYIKRDGQPFDYLNNVSFMKNWFVLPFRRTDYMRCGYTTYYHYCEDIQRLIDDAKGRYLDYYMYDEGEDNPFWKLHKFTEQVHESIGDQGQTFCLSTIAVIADRSLEPYIQDLFGTRSRQIWHELLMNDILTSAQIRHHNLMLDREYFEKIIAEEQKIIAEERANYEMACDNESRAYDIAMINAFPDPYYMMCVCTSRCISITS